MNRSPIVALGCGYVGRALYAAASARHRDVLASSRRPQHRLDGIPPDRRMQFDLAEPATWRAIPDAARVVWCFPAEPPDAVEAFCREVGPRLATLVVLGSTGSYDVPPGLSPSSAPPLVDETWPLQASRPRVKGEELLRRTCRAIVLRVAGIYGPGRHVLDWLRQGRITDHDRTVNLVHVQDLAAIGLLALERGRPGEVYNVSDGHPRPWREIIDWAADRGYATLPVRNPQSAGDGARTGGKRISIAKLERELGYRFAYPDLYTALDEIEREKPCGPIEPLT